MCNWHENHVGIQLRVSDYKKFVIHVDTIIIIIVIIIIMIMMMIIIIIINVYNIRFGLK